MPNVVIIGAGAAGLAAAGRLHRKGIGVIVLEARERIGGRIFTVRDPAGRVPVELGAEFIHGRPPVTFDIVRAAGLRVVEGSDQRLIRNADGFVPLPNFWDIIERLDGQIDRNSRLTYDEFLQVAKGSVFEKRIAKAYVEGFNAARAEVISAAAVAVEDEASEQIEGNRAFRFLEGYHGLVAHLAGELPSGAVRTGVEVHEVRWRKGSAEVRSSAGQGPHANGADRVLLTVPVGVWCASPGETGAIVFEPPLAGKREAASRIEPGNVMKVIMLFREPFWKRLLPEGCEQMGFALDLDAAFPTWWDQPAISPNMLTGWAGGSAAKLLCGGGRAAILAQAIASLAKVLSVDASTVERELESWHFHDWSADPFTRGAYSYPAVGGIEAAQELARPVEDTLFFAGEATDFHRNNGTVHGALDSGLRAAEEIISTLE